MITYFDASSLVKYFLEEDGSQEIRALVAKSLPTTSRLSEVEVSSAICRRFREGYISEDLRERALNLLAEVFTGIYIVELTPGIAESARGLLATYPLRAGDAIQLASFLAIKARTGKDVSFSAFDQRLLEVAESALSATRD